MRGSGPLTINTTRLYGYFTAETGTLRLRVSCDEWEAMGLNEGQRVRVGLPNQEQEARLILNVTAAPPFVWLELGTAALAAG